MFNQEKVNRLLSKPAYAREIGGDSEHTNRQESRFAQALAESRGPRMDRVKTGVYTRVHEDSSTESTSKLSAKVGFGKKSNITKGVILSIFSALLFSVMAALDKLIANETSIFVILFLQSASALMLTIFYGFPKLKYELFKTAKINFYCIRGLLGVFGVFGCLFISLKSLSITDGLVLNATSPLFIPIFLFLTYRLRVSFKALLFMLVGFSGVILTLHPDGHMLNIAGSLALLSGACTAIIIVILKILAKDEPIERMAFYYCLISTLCSGGFLLYNHPATISLFVCLIGCLMGICFAVYQLLVYKSLTYISSQVAGSFYYCSIIFSVGLDYLSHHSLPTFSNLCGIAIIIMGSIALVNTKLNHKV